MEKRRLFIAAFLCISTPIAIYAQSGNVGIGTSTPASKLTVNGNASIGGSYTGTAAPSDGAIIQGKVGIGTSAPLSHLHLSDTATGGSLVGTSNPANIAVRFENINNGQAMTQLFTTKNSSGALRQAVVGINPDWLGNGVYVIGRDGHTNDILVDLATGHTGMGADPDANIRINLGDSAGTSENPIARVSNISPVAAGNKAIIGFNSYNGGGSTWGIGPEQNTTNPFDSKFHIMSSTGGNYIRRMTFDQSGNVGIANTSPVARLDIAGNIKIADGTQGLGKLLVSDATGLATWQDAPTAIGASNFWNILGNSGTNPATNFLGTTDNQALVFRTNNTEKMRIAANGFVGVGSNAPATKMHILSTSTGGNSVLNTNTANMALRLENTNNGQSIIQHFLSKDAGGGVEEFIMGINPIYNGGEGVFVMTPDGASNLRTFQMDLVTGNIGMGVVPGAATKLSVGNDNPNVLNLLTGAATIPGGATSGLLVMNKVGAAVSGDVWANFVAAGSTVGWIGSNSATTVAYNTSSDIRLKENIKNTHFGIDDVMKIDVKDYSYKADAAKTPQTGFIAQQLYTIFPSAVTKGGDDVTTSPWAVDYGKVTPLLTKAIQDQQKMIEQLEAKVKMLETENQKLTTAAEEVSATKKAYAELAQEVKEMQQMLGISKIAAGSKVATK